MSLVPSSVHNVKCLGVQHRRLRGKNAPVELGLRLCGASTPLQGRVAAVLRRAAVVNRPLCCSSRGARSLLD